MAFAPQSAFQNPPSRYGLIAGNGRFPRQQSGAAALGPYPNPGRQRPQLAFFSCSNDLVAAALTVWNVCWATFVPRKAVVTKFEAMRFTSLS